MKIKFILFIISIFITSNIIISLLFVLKVQFNIECIELLSTEIFLPKNIVFGFFLPFSQLVVTLVCIHTFYFFDFRKILKVNKLSILYFSYGAVIGVIPLMIIGGYFFAFDLYSISINEVNFPYLLYGSILCFLIALNEEYLTRGFIYSLIKKNTSNKYLPLLISTFIFVIFHVFSPDFSFLYALELILAGFLLGLFRYKGKNIFIPIGIHFSLNYMVLFIFSFSEVSIKTLGIFQFELKKMNDYLFFIPDNHILSFFTILIYGFLILTVLIFVKKEKGNKY